MEAFLLRFDPRRCKPGATRFRAAIAVVRSRCLAQVVWALIDLFKAWTSRSTGRRGAGGRDQISDPGPDPDLIPIDPDSDPAAGTETEAETEAETDPDPETDPETETDPDADPETDPDAETDPDLARRPQPPAVSMRPASLGRQVAGRS